MMNNELEAYKAELDPLCEDGQHILEIIVKFLEYVQDGSKYNNRLIDILDNQMPRGYKGDIVQRNNNSILSREDNKFIIKIVEYFEFIQQHERGYLFWDKVKTKEIKDAIKNLLLSIKELDICARNNFGKTAEDFENIIIKIEKAIEVFNKLTPDIKDKIKIKKNAEENEKLKKEIEDHKKAHSEAVEGLQKEIGSIRENAAKKSADAASDFFDEQARYCKRRVRKLFRAMLVLIALIASLAILFLCKDIGFDNQHIIEKTLIKFFLFSVLLSTLYQGFKSYNAYSHQYIVNKHRHLCLKTYVVDFSNSVHSKEAKDTILMKVADSIFDIGDTGFAKVNQDKEKQNYQLTLSPKINTSDSK